MVAKKICSLLILLFWSFLVRAQSTAFIQKLSLAFESRQMKMGKVVTFKGDVFYTANANMVTHFTYPIEQVITYTALGEGKIYDPEKNTVTLVQSMLLSTHTTPVYFFLSNKTADMGLTTSGFYLADYKMQDSIQITNYYSGDPSVRSLIKQVELAHKNGVPIYMAYKDNKNNILRKTYYTNYQLLNTIKFPGNITEILYEGKDSTVTRTKYTNFAINQQAESKYFNFTIPPTAKKVN